MPEKIDRTDWRRFLSAPAGDLDDTDPDNEDPGGVSLADQLDSEHIEELKAARKYRQQLVPFTKWCVACVLASAVAVMGLYIGSEWGELAPEVVLGFFGAVVVETIGILYIISTYLFPKGGANRHNGEDGSSGSDR